MCTAAKIAVIQARMASSCGESTSVTWARRSATSSSSTWRTISATSDCLLGKYSYSEAMPTPARSATWLVVSAS
ncbi:hypothetical protein [Nannocystis pusilla]|uniref:hypothetical protein n=1 Tax=Nannocystis pusilla TaxID=889268 RepID=UPI003B7787FE